jgi:hypothetical protein
MVKMRMWQVHKNPPIDWLYHIPLIQGQEMVHIHLFLILSQMKIFFPELPLGRVDPKGRNMAKEDMKKPRFARLFLLLLPVTIISSL